jgi:hypothetical protein
MSYLPYEDKALKSGMIKQKMEIIREIIKIIVKLK